MGKTATDAKPAGGKLRLNIIDFLIVVVILGAIIGITLRFGLVERITNQSGLTSARISFLILDINDESWNYFAVGDRFIDAEHDCELGVLESRQFIPAEAFIVNEYGELFKRNSGNEQRIDVRGTYSRILYSSPRNALIVSSVTICSAGYRKCSLSAITPPRM